MKMNIPIIDIEKVGLLVKEDEDIKEEDFRRVGGEIYQAMSDSGFAYLKNAGITDEEVNEFQDTYEKFFKLDFETKGKYNYERNVAGYIGINNFAYGVRDYKEAFLANGLYFDQPPESFPNKHVPQIRQKTMDFCEICAKLSKRLLRALSFGMKLKDPNFLAERHQRLNGSDNFTSLRSNFYPAMKDEVVGTADVRLGAHSDYDSFTLLFQDCNGGLQAKNKNGKFEEVPPIPQTVVMNTGDIMNYWTDGRIKSTVHQVGIPQNKSTRLKARKSLAYFVEGDNDVVIDKMDYLDEADDPAPGEVVIKRTSESLTIKEWVLKRYYEQHGLDKTK